MHPTLYIGCAGWSIPSQTASAFPAEGTHLERYAAGLPAVEINSSFKRRHRPATYARWAESTGPGFRFSVKVPAAVTHGGRLPELGALEDFLPGPLELGGKLGPLLVQLPPSLEFDAAVADRFFAGFCARFDGEIVCEPRHPGWFSPAADELLSAHRVARVAADPAPIPAAGAPGGWRGLAYFRLHGSPRTYYSSYGAAYLQALRVRLAAASAGNAVWCIFDNTAAGAAIPNALDLQTIAGSA